MRPDPTADNDKSLRVLIVGSDPVLEDEFRSALSRIPDRKGSVHSVDTYRDALETPLPANLRALISVQYADVQRTHDVIKQYRDAYERLPDVQ